MSSFWKVITLEVVRDFFRWLFKGGKKDDKGKRKAEAEAGTDKRFG
jgi:hypothetical protein